MTGKTPPITLVVVALVTSCSVFALGQPQAPAVCVPATGERPPIIDVHMHAMPQVYADLSKISDANAYPREQFHDYLRSLVRANLGDRLMFGSDAAGPGALGPSIEGITSAAFLGERQKRAILCENAARFFRLTTRPGVAR